MKINKLILAAALNFFLVSSILFAQEADAVQNEELHSDKASEKEQSGLEFENRFSIEKKDKIKFDWSLNLLQEFHGYENGDLRELNESSDLEIQYTDDRVGLALTRARFDGKLSSPRYNVGGVFSFGFDGAWGHDQFLGFANPGLRIGRLNAYWNIFDNSVASSKLILGRQFFTIGGSPVDYIQRDILDAVVLSSHFKGIMNLDLLLVDFFSGANNYGSDTGEVWNDEFQFLVRDDSEILAGFRGDVSTYRFGIIAGFKELLDKSFKHILDPRAYIYYANIRGNGGGSDRSENGERGNFSDNDYQLLFGGRIFYGVASSLLPDAIEEVSLFADVAYSVGQDIRREGEPDIDGNGLGVGGGFIINFNSVPKILSNFIEMDVFFAQGGKYDSNGNQTSHGFVSFKGDEAGGLLLRRYWGVHPSAYTDDDGIDDTPFDANRKSSMLLAHFSLGFDISKIILIELEYWFLLDTNTSDVNFENVGDLPVNFKSIQELQAQEKFGEILGHEINLNIKYQANDLLSFTVVPAIFIPGKFYEKAITDIVSGNGGPKGGDQDALFYGISVGTQMKL